ncbi:MAG TPA: catechol 1,2-dioxygenase [Pseudonocardiaceae bacterium]|jgi:aromatic ring-opening dioxygenase catalytic subunit (LigB family)|nr:catechol 1,2-dioxygenase [Pseudonocardiaceae bacterium]
MGEVVGAGILAHVPTIMLPEDERRELNEGNEISLVPGLRRLRTEVLDVLRPDTVIVVDSHWATTMEWVVASHSRRAGRYTSEELPRGLARMPYDFAGDPELAHAIAGHAGDHDTWITAIDDEYLPVHYATLNLWSFLRGGERWVSMSVCQTAEMADALALGAAIADGVADVDRRVVLIGSGAMSHTFYPLRQLRDHESSDPKHVFTAEAMAADQERLEWFRRGEHDRVLATMPDFYRYKPEARFLHYLTTIGALGGPACTARGRLFSEYENAVGTGQVHVWFDRPAGGWTAPRVLETA